MTEQPTRKTARRRERPDGFDRTSLRANGIQANAVHRDYAAHFFRWGFAKRFIRRGDRVLDIGCGVDLPLVRTLLASQSHVPGLYLGVDVNREPRQGPLRVAWTRYAWETDFSNARAAAALTREHGPFSVIVSLEAIEHMPLAAGRRLLRNAREALAPGGVFLLSTPVYNGKAAVNHVHEYTYDELQRETTRAGLTTRRRFGTFASRRDVTKVASRAELELMSRLREYYDDDVLACFLAPLYPEASRNTLMVLERSA